MEDFSFEGPLGSAGTTLRRVGRNHFVATLGAAPNHPEWCNKIQCTIAQHALGNALRLEVEFPSPAMSLNECDTLLLSSTSPLPLLFLTTSIVLMS